MHGKQTLRFGGDFREHPRRQPHRRRTRAAASSSPACTPAAISPTSCSACRSRRRVQFGPGTEQFPVALVGPVRPGRLARHRQAHGQRRAALRVLLAAVGGEQPSRDARRRARTSRRRCRSRPAAIGPYSGQLPDTIVRPDPRRPRAARRRRLAAAARARSSARGYGINYNSSVYQSIAQQLAGQPPFAIDRHGAGTSPDTLLPIETALLRRAARARRRTPSASIPNYRARLRADLESRRAARSDAHGAARRRLHRHEGLEPRHPARAEPRAGRRC